MENDRKNNDDKNEVKIIGQNPEQSQIIVPFSEEIPPKKQKPTFLEVLGKLSPGKSLRTALDDILEGKTGALIVVDCPELENLMDGGFKINCRFTPQRLAELAKMDGAIILSDDLKKVISCNVLLVPKSEIPSNETGTRHKAAERIAKQINTLVMAVSERKNKITLYYGDIRYELSGSSEILRRAAETLQILEKQKDIFNDLISNLNILEINNLVSTSDVCSVLQRLEIVNRISAMVKRYLIELGKEGIIVSMRLKELTRNLSREEELILKDYFGSKWSKSDAILESMSFDTLLETHNISQMLFNELNDKSISPRGLRILNKTNLSEEDIKFLITNFKKLDKILNANEETLIKVFKRSEYIEFFNKEIENLKEKILVGRKI